MNWEAKPFGRPRLLACCETLAVLFVATTRGYRDEEWLLHK